MAEAYLKKFGSDFFIADSAGLEPGKLNPLVVEVMKEDGIDISNNPTKDVFEYFKQGKIFNYVVTVCDAASAERCPIFPGISGKIAWSFADPPQFTGTHEEKLAQTRIVRDDIKAHVLKFISETKNQK
jgi:arsenate reductase